MGAWCACCPMGARTPMRAMTEEEIEAAALSDPDAQPLTEAQLARAQPVSRDQDGS